MRLKLVVMGGDLEVVDVGPKRMLSRMVAWVWVSGVGTQGTGLCGYPQVEFYSSYLMRINKV